MVADIHTTTHLVRSDQTRCGLANDSKFTATTMMMERFDSQEIAAMGLGRAAQGGDARTTALFALGPHYLFGRLFHLAFHIQERVMAPVQALVQSAISDGALVLAVHMRHRNPSYDGHEGAVMYANALRGVLLRRRSAGKACVILLASDRRTSKSALSDALRGNSCTLVSMPRPLPEQSVSQDSSTGKGEHGDDVGDVAMQDLALLSHADVLLTGFASTFGMLVYELMAARQARRAREHLASVVICDVPGKSGRCLEELPLIGSLHWHQSLVRWPMADIHTNSTQALVGERIGHDHTCSQLIKQRSSKSSPALLQHFYDPVRASGYGRL